MKGIPMLWALLANTFLLQAQILQPLNPRQLSQAGVDENRLSRIDTLFEQYVRAQKIGGATVIAAKNGQIIYEKAFGYSDGGRKKPMTKDAIFRIASQTKAITSVGIMLLLEEGKLLLDDPVQKYLPEFSNIRVLEKFNTADSSYTTVPAKTPITIRQLLTHTTGIGYAQIGTPEYNAMAAKADITAGIGVAPGRILQNDMQKLAALPLLHQPGERFTYGLNTDVLGYLIEVVSGLPLDRFFKTRIFDPLGMKDTWFYLPADRHPRLVTLFTEDSLKKAIPAGKSIYRNGPWITDYPLSQGTYFSGGAGLSSTAYDYAIFMEMLRNKGVYNGQRIISSNATDMMTQNQIGAIDRGPYEKFGLGFGIITAYGSGKTGLSEGTYSWGGAFSSTYFIDPREAIIAQVFINQMPMSHGDIHDKFKILLYASLMSDPMQLK